MRAELGLGVPGSAEPQLGVGRGETPTCVARCGGQLRGRLRWGARTNWEVERHLVEFERGGRTRAEYGAGLLALVAERLTAELGSGLDQRNQRNMNEIYPFFPIWNALRPKLNCKIPDTHFYRRWAGKRGKAEMLK